MKSPPSTLRTRTSQMVRIGTEGPDTGVDGAVISAGSRAARSISSNSGES